jgi:hypothetical protein
MIYLATIVCVLCAACSAAPQVVPTPAPTPAPMPAPTPAPAPTPPAEAESVGALLDRLEERGRTMRDFSAAVVVEQFDALTEEREVRRARVVMKGGDGPKRIIGIVIDEFIDSSGRGATDGRRFLFKDGWLMELEPARKQMVRRQLARTGESLDPLRPGDGPFIVPLGQPRAEVEREFVVTAVPIPVHNFFQPLRAAADGLCALQLMAREGTEAHRSIRRMTLVFDSATLAPRGVEVVKPNGDTERVLLRESVIDGGIDEKQATVIELPDMTGWRIDERPLPREADASPAHSPSEPRG